MDLKTITIMVTGELDGIMDLCKSISDDNPKVISNGTNFAVITIRTTANAPEVKDYVADVGRTLIVAEMGEHGSAHFDSPGIAEDLYGEDYAKYSGTTAKSYVDEINKVATFNPDEWDKKSAAEMIDTLLGDGKNIPESDMTLINQLSNIV